MPGLDQAVKDPDFLKASVPDQMAYLAHVDPDFKSASSEDKLAYLNHITGKQAPTTANNQAENASAKEGGFGEAAKGFLKAPFQQVVPVARAINKIPHIGETLSPKQGIDALEQMTTPENRSQEIGANVERAGEVLLPMGAEAGAAAEAGRLVPFAKGVGRVLTGGYVGKEAGKYLGGKVGLPQVGETVGGLAGALAGGGLLGERAAKIGNPSEIPVIGKYLPDLAAETPKNIPVMSKEPLTLTPPPAVREAPVQDTMHFGKPVEPVVSTGPFKLEAPAAVHEPPVQSSFPTVGPLEAPKAPEIAPMNATAQIPHIERPVETHPFAPPPNAMAPNQIRPAVNPMAEEFPLQRSGPGFEANVRHAGNVEELEAAARRQHEYINGADFAKAAENNPEVVAEAKKMANNADSETDARGNKLGSIQRAYKNLMGEDVHITANKAIKQAGTMKRIEAMQAMIKKGFSPDEIVKAGRTPKE